MAQKPYFTEDHFSGGRPAPFAELPVAFQTLQQRMLKTPRGDREMVEILALVLQHDEQAVLTAVELALEAGAPTKTQILNVLHRLIDGNSQWKSTRRSEIFRRPRPKRVTMRKSRRPPKRRDSNKTVSDKPGEVQFYAFARRNSINTPSFSWLRSTLPLGLLVRRIDYRYQGETAFGVLFHGLMKDAKSIQQN
jgi:hypothetical protein